MASKIKKFKPKSRNGIKKRLKLTGAKDPSKVKVIVNRINKGHRLIRKTGQRKLRAARDTVLGKVADKYKKVIK
jgi:ribosomal protein L35